jgi:S-DNA-T family DNA segregation ATPase FtsK/SpoIIIE
MAKKPVKSNAPTFLPRGAADFLRRRALQVIGLALLGTAGGLVLALQTYRPGDPSFNSTGDGAAIANALGYPGAVIADMLLQTFGLASLLLPAALIFWGLRFLLLLPFGRWWLRLPPLALALPFGAVTASPFPVLGAWASNLKSGGFLGSALLDRSIAALGAYAPELAEIAVPPTLALACGFFTFIFIWLVSGFTFGEIGAIWRRITAISQSVGDVASKANQGIKSLGEGAASMISATRDRIEPKLFSSPGGAPLPVAEEESDKSEAELIASPAPRATPGKRERESRQKKLALPELDPDGFQLPPLDLLAMPTETGKYQKINEDSLSQNAKVLEAVLQDFGINGQIVKVRPGPVVTLYELEPTPGTRTARVIGLSDDIARSMSVVSARIATIPGRNVIGIELPNAKRETVFLRELLASDAFERAPARLTLALGKDIAGAPVLVDLARMPHLLIAGTTGSGKSVGINTMILSLLYRLTPDECRMIMIDPKMLELSVYDGIPHLLAPVVTEPKKAVVALKWTVREMEDRYRAMSQLGVRNIAGYNQRLIDAANRGEVLGRTVQTGFDQESGKPIFEEQPLNLTPLPFIVVVVDEMADLMLVAGKEIEAAVQRLAQMARAAGIHLIMATQRPSVDVITGTIKANFPTRVSFQVTSKIDSRTILGEQGAEQLLGQGDMLYMASGGRIQRVHGPFASDNEVEVVVAHLREQGVPQYEEAVTIDEDEMMVEEGSGRNSPSDDLYDQAVSLVLRSNKASTSFVQRELNIGYNRAAKLMDRMEAEGIVGPANHVGKREILGR